MPKEIDPTARIGEGFVPTPIPIGPDGIPAGVPVAPAPKLALIPLCQLGPCVHYHEVVTKMDAQDPTDGTDGEVFVHRTRTCYPTAGIEMDVSLHPVYRCNLWEPDLDRATRIAALRETFALSRVGVIELNAFAESWPVKLTTNGDQ